MKKNKGSRTISVRLTNDQIDRLKKISKNMSRTARVVIEKFIENNSPKQ